MGLSDYVDPDEDTPEGIAFRTGEAKRDRAAKVLHRTSDEGLLKTFASLTHRLHVADRQRAVSAHDIRAQRNRVEEEILRRMKK